MDTQIIRNYMDANLLIHMGNQCKGIDKNKKDNKYLIFFFDKTPKLVDDLNILTQRRKENEK